MRAYRSMLQNGLALYVGAQATLTSVTCGCKRLRDDHALKQYTVVGWNGVA